MEIVFRRLKAAGNHWKKLMEKGGFWRILVGGKLGKESGFSWNILERDRESGVQESESVVNEG